MIIFEFLAKLFVDVIQEGVLRKFWRFIGNGLIKLDELIYGNKKISGPNRLLKKKYLNKQIELIKNINEELKIGQKGIVIEIINDKQVLVEFTDRDENQIQLNNYSVVRVGMNQFRLKK